MCIQQPSSRSGTLVLTQVARLFTLIPLLRISASLRGGMHTRHLWAQTLPPPPSLRPSVSLPHTHVDQPVLFCSFFFSPSLSAVLWHQPCCPDELVTVTETQDTGGLPHSGTTVCTGVSYTCLTTCTFSTLASSCTDTCITVAPALSYGAQSSFLDCYSLDVFDTSTPSTIGTLWAKMHPIKIPVGQ